MGREKFASTVVSGAFAAAVLAFAAGSAAAADQDPMYQPSGGPSTVLFTGIDIKEDSWFGYGGGIYAFNGLGGDGFAVRGFVGGGEFDYVAQPSGFFAGGPVDGDTVTFDAQAGYRMFMEGIQFGIYAGVNYWDIDQDLIGQDVDAVGEEIGFKIDGEISHSDAGPLYFDFRGSYSTAFSTYWARGRAGYNTGFLVLGPEVSVGGNDDYDQLRVGAFGLFGIGGTGVSVSVSGGYAEVDGAGSGDSAYGTVGLSAAF